MENPAESMRGIVKLRLNSSRDTVGLRTKEETVVEYRKSNRLNKNERKIPVITT